MKTMMNMVIIIIPNVSNYDEDHDEYGPHDNSKNQDEDQDHNQCEEYDGNWFKGETKRSNNCHKKSLMLIYFDLWVE